MLYLTFSYAHKSILLLDLLNFYNLAIGFFFLLNKIGLFLLLLTLMFAFVWALFSTLVSYNLLRWLCILLITLSGDVERNPRPKRNAPQTLSICHWNLNSTCAHNFAKLHLLRAYVSVHKSGITCSSETCLDSSVDDESVEISEYYLIRSDHPSNKYSFGICICYNNVLPLKVTGVLF